MIGFKRLRGFKKVTIAKYLTPSHNGVPGIVDKQKSVQGNKQRLDWYQEAKFGLFLHWGAYSVAGVEASWPIMAPDLSEAMFKNRKKNHGS